MVMSCETNCLYTLKAIVNTADVQRTLKCDQFGNSVGALELCDFSPFSMIFDHFGFTLYSPSAKNGFFELGTFVVHRISRSKRKLYSKSLRVFLVKSNFDN